MPLDKNVSKTAFLLVPLIASIPSQLALPIIPLSAIVKTNTFLVSPKFLLPSANTSHIPKVSHAKLSIARIALKSNPFPLECAHGILFVMPRIIVNSAKQLENPANKTMNAPVEILALDDV